MRASLLFNISDKFEVWFFAIQGFLDGQENGHCSMKFFFVGPCIGRCLIVPVYIPVPMIRSQVWSTDAGDKFGAIDWPIL